jgi:septal ring factor EnvC (AmiA/AmiB activator)
MLGKLWDFCGFLFRLPGLLDDLHRQESKCQELEQDKKKLKEELAEMKIVNSKAEETIDTLRAEALSIKAENFELNRRLSGGGPGYASCDPGWQ